MNESRPGSILVFGHTGFTGNWLSRFLNKQGWQVFGASQTSSVATTLFPASNRCIEREFVVDVRDFPATSKLIQELQPWGVVNLAAISQVIECRDRPLESFATNALGTANILESCLSSDSVKAFVTATTDKVYLEGANARKETDQLWPFDPYSASKVGAEAYLEGRREFIEKSILSVAVFRGGNILGGGDWANNRIVPDLVRSWSQRLPLRLRYASAIRPWQHVLDLCQAYSIGLTEPPEENRMRALNVGPPSQSHVAVSELLNLFESEGIVARHESALAPYTETVPLFLDSSKILETTNYRHVLSLEEVVHLTSSWYKAVLGKKESTDRVTQSQIEDYLGLLLRH